MPNLFPEGYEYEIITDADRLEEQPIGYRNGSAFDYELGDYRRDGKNRILDSDGVEAWKAWVINCASTDRYKHHAYSTDFGIEKDPIFAAKSREEAESLLARFLTEAILADDYQRTEYIESMEFSWPAPDGIRVDMILHGIDDVTIDVTAYITKGES